MAIEAHFGHLKLFSNAGDSIYHFLMRKFLAVILVVSFLAPVNSVAAVKSGDKCTKLNATSTSSGKKYTCTKIGTRLVWDKGLPVKTAAKPVTPSTDATPVPAPSAAPLKQVDLPSNGSQCTKIGEKIMNGDTGMRCSWAGHSNTEQEALQHLQWRPYEITRVSTSKTNNYPSKPSENNQCQNSGDTYDISGGILECRWISGKQLKWIKVNTVKKTFPNAKSPVSIDVCKLQNSAMTVVRGPRDGTQFSGFPLPKPDYMNVKGKNDVLIVPVDFPDFQGGNELKAQIENDTKLLVDWYNYYSGGQTQFSVTSLDRWLRMPKDRSAYPTDEKNKDATGSDLSLIHI
jgi:hypothetical protein